MSMSIMLPDHLDDKAEHRICDCICNDEEPQPEWNAWIKGRYHAGNRLR